MSYFKSLWPFLTVLIFHSALVQAQVTPICQSPFSDSDGDGWGWENGDSCLVASNQQGNQNSSSNPANTTQSSTVSDCVDYDGDGFGWSETEQDTCIPGGSQSSNSAPANNNQSSTVFDCVDSDGDGYGWSETEQDTCIPGGSQSSNSAPANNNQSSTVSDCVDSDGDGYGWSETEQDTCIVGSGSSFPSSSLSTGFRPSDITDIILTAGQSNAVGQSTSFSSPRDDSHPRVFVWTYDQGWQLADLRSQTWWSGNHPSKGGVGQSHPGFHIAKSLAEKTNSVIGLIATGSPGQSINFWDEGKPAFPEIISRVNNALSALSHKSSLDMIWWMQGESDANASNYYREKFLNLISRFRQQRWFNSQALFVANETSIFDVNQIFRELDFDNDSSTCSSVGEGLPTFSDRVHFTGDAFRQMGNAVSELYLSSCDNF